MKKKIVSILVLILALGSVLALTGCGSKDDDEKVIKVGATPAPHAEVLEVVKEKLAEDGYTLEIVEYNEQGSFRRRYRC